MRKLLTLAAIVVFGLTLGAIRSAQAVELSGDDTFVLDFIANDDGGGGNSNFPVAVYWKWDGNQTLGIRMETPQGDTGFSALWSFNVFCDGSSPGGLDSSGSNVSSITNISIGQAFSAASLGAYAVPVDAIEATWIQPCSGGGPFDPSQTAVYIQLTIGGGNFPGDGYRMADFLPEGGTYADPPDILNVAGFCATTNGTCALLTFSSAPTFSGVGFGPPMDNGPVAVKKNRVLPLKCELLDDQSDPVTDGDITAAPVLQVVFTPIVGDAVDVTGDALSAGQGTDGNQFEFDGTIWRFNLKIKNYTAPGTYEVSMVSGDSDEYVIDPTCTGSFVID